MEVSQSIKSESSSKYSWRVFIPYGLLSGFLYASGFLAFAFLIPIQYVFRKENKREGLLSILVSLSIVAAISTIELSRMGWKELPIFLQTLLLPALLLATIGAMNLLKSDAWVKIIAATIVVSVLFAYLFSISIGTPEARRSIADMIAQLLNSSGIQDLDASAIEQNYVIPAISIIMRSFGVASWLLLAGSWHIGNSLASARIWKQKGEAKKNAFVFSVPSWLLWPSILGWLALICVLYGNERGVFAIIAWNVSLAAACWYALQGFSLISYFFRLRNMQRLAGLLLILLMILMFYEAKIRIAAAILAPMLGVSEVWLQYRMHKGA
ncbi:MAG TPA: DUF2232 domain-containing protein [Rectinema sp.]|jgi:uncharacterized protein YybS (DUF2232 family)|nr:DUF2232 domain-containing protein [Spirochaetia bacterium]OQC74634.1 MAG: hypothetical protein BWX44_00739 [Spirochaetes bacterium ADurb.Bin001]HNP92237.1 DUF2232 domain-containing protein [Rectinema sp.]HNT58625.1 DUF2232 domain-containing protein [Rectinema sp.]HNV35392.1 DUF2232 domain-containing protein [Rectinema sp.]